MPYYSDDIIEEVRSRNDIVDVISQYVRLSKRAVPILDSARSIMKNRLLFRVAEQADVLLLRMRRGWKCIYVSDGV